MSIFVNSIGSEISMFLGDMTASVSILVALGLILVIAEFFRPMKGLGYGCGFSSLVLGVIMGMLASPSVGALFIMSLFIAFVLLAAHLVMIALQKREWLFVSTGIIDEENADKYSYLVGLCGTTTTSVAPNGHMSINDINFYVTSSEPIDVGVEVIVRRVSGDRIIVEPVDSAETEENA